MRGGLPQPPYVERKRLLIEDEEGCLSFPGLYQKIRRAKTIKVQAYDLKGSSSRSASHDLEARAWQHEIDHLNGVLFIDNMGAIAPPAAVKEFKVMFQQGQKGEIPADAEIEKILAALERGAVRIPLPLQLSRRYTRGGSARLLAETRSVEPRSHVTLWFALTLAFIAPGLGQGQDPCEPP